MKSNRNRAVLGKFEWGGERGWGWGGGGGGGDKNGPNHTRHFEETKFISPLRSSIQNVFLEILVRTCTQYHRYTVKILKIGTPEIITIIVLQLEQLDFTVQYCLQKMQTE